MYFDAHFIFNTFRSRGVFMFVLCLMILCSVRPSFAAEAEATLQAEITDDSAIEAAGIVSEHGQLSVSSSGFVVDKNQSVFQIQGISTHNLAWYPEYVNVDTFRKLRDEFNINTIRLAMYTAEDGGYCVSDDTARQQMLACLTSGIEAAIQLDMYVIVDWHILSDSNPNLYKETALSFFERIASTYGDKPNILYEICNEPNGCSWKEIKSYATDIIKTIRKYDKKAVIIVGTPTWSQLGTDGTSNEVADSPIKGYKNIMYSLHFYASEWAHNEYLPAKVAYARKKKLPIIVSEFGLSPASGDGAINKASADKWMKLLNKYNISYFCWSLSNKNESASLLKPSTKKTSGWKSGDLSTAGKYIKKKYLARKKALGKKA